MMGAAFLDWLACVQACITRRWPDCAVACSFPCFPGALPAGLFQVQVPPQ